MTYAARRPVGGYVLAGGYWLLLAIIPIVAVWHAISSQLVDAGVTVLAGLIVFYVMGEASVEVNEDVWQFRSYLRANHPWIYRIGVGIRLVGIISAVLAFVIDIFIFNHPQIVAEFITVMFLLLLLSVFSVTTSMWFSSLIRPSTH